MNAKKFHNRIINYFQRNKIFIYNLLCHVFEFIFSDVNCIINNFLYVFLFQVRDIRLLIRSIPYI